MDVFKLPAIERHPKKAKADKVIYDEEQCPFSSSGRATDL